MKTQKRFFIFQSEQDQKSNVYLPTCSVLDRETIINGRYAVLAENMKYLDAWDFARKLNDEQKQ